MWSGEEESKINKSLNKKQSKAMGNAKRRSERLVMNQMKNSDKSNNNNNDDTNVTKVTFGDITIKGMQNLNGNFSQDLSVFGNNNNDDDIKNKDNSNNRNNDKKHRISRSKRAGIILPVGRFNRHLHEKRYAPRIAESASVYLAAAIEYVLGEVLELAGNTTLLEKRRRLTARDIMKAVRRDEELDELVGGKTVIPSSGVVYLASKFQKPDKANKKKQRIEKVFSHKK